MLLILQNRGIISWLARAQTIQKNRSEDNVWKEIPPPIFPLPLLLPPPLLPAPSGIYKQNSRRILNNYNSSDNDDTNDDNSDGKKKSWCHWKRISNGNADDWMGCARYRGDGGASRRESLDESLMVISARCLYNSLRLWMISLGGGARTAWSITVFPELIPIYIIHLLSILLFFRLKIWIARSKLMTPAHVECMRQWPESHSSINLLFGVVIVDAESNSVASSAVDANPSDPKQFPRKQSSRRGNKTRRQPKIPYRCARIASVSISISSLLEWVNYTSELQLKFPARGQQLVTQPDSFRPFRCRK